MDKVEPILTHVIAQHVEEASSTWLLRTLAVHGHGRRLREIAKVDARVEAHVDGLRIAGPGGSAMSDQGLEPGEASSTFVATLLALEEPVSGRFRRLLASAESLPQSRAGFWSAFGWSSLPVLRGTVKDLLRAESPFARCTALAACGMHRIDPRAALDAGLDAASSPLRARAFRLVGELGRLDMMSACLTAIGADDPDTAVWAALSAVLLGDRGIALNRSAEAAIGSGLHRQRAFLLTLAAMSVDVSHGLLQRLARQPDRLRWLIQGSGIAGDPTYVPWLISHMASDEIARLAGEALSLITGLDLGQLGLDRQQPENFESGPNDDPDDPNVDMDPDDGLPWPDPEKIKGWWAKNSNRFTPGQRYFMGAPVTRAHCINVLKNGYQRQRILAAHYLCLLEPGTPLFNTSAPAWRQQKLLAQMV